MICAIQKFNFLKVLFDQFYVLKLRKILDNFPIFDDIEEICTYTSNRLHLSINSKKMTVFVCIGGVSKEASRHYNRNSERKVETIVPSSLQLRFALL